MSEVEVPVNFFATEGFSARRDGRYIIWDVSCTVRSSCHLAVVRLNVHIARTLLKDGKSFHLKDIEKT